MVPFKTVEFSDPAYERDGLRYITVRSKHLGRRGDILVYLPSANSSQLNTLPLVLLLHGVYGSAWSWAFQGGAHITAEKMIKTHRIQPMLLAMPSDGLWGDGSGYSVHSGMDFEKWIVEETISAVGELLDLDNYAPRICIGGLSMGGYGAFRLGIIYADLFSAISSHSSITDWNEFEYFSDENYQNIAPPPEQRNIIDLILHSKIRLPPIRFDCGTADPLIGGNRKLHRDLLEAGLNHIYQENLGGHEWHYWQHHLTDSLLFFDQILNSEKDAPHL